MSSFVVLANLIQKIIITKFVSYLLFYKIMNYFHKISKYVLLSFILVNILQAQADFDTKIDSLNKEIRKRNQEIDTIKDKIKKLKIEKNKIGYNEVLTGGKVVEVTSRNAKFSIGEKLEFLSEKIELPKGDKLTVYPIVAKYSQGYSYRAEYQGVMGWIYKTYFDEYSSGMRRLAKDNIIKMNREIEEEDRKNDLMSKNKTLEKFPIQFRDAISKKRIKIGMTREMVIASIGYPEDENKTTNAYGDSTQMVYRDGKYKYVYLDDGIVTSFQQ